MVQGRLALEGGRARAEYTFVGRYVDSEILRKVDAFARAFHGAIQLLDSDVLLSVVVSYDHDNGEHSVTIHAVPMQRAWVDGAGRYMHALVLYEHDDLRKVHTARAVVKASTAMVPDRFAYLVAGLVRALSLEGLDDVTERIRELTRLFDDTLTAGPLRGVETTGIDLGGDYTVEKLSLRYFEGVAKLEDVLAKAQ